MLCAEFESPEAIAGHLRHVMVTVSSHLCDFTGLSLFQALRLFGAHLDHS